MPATASAGCRPHCAAPLRRNACRARRSGRHPRRVPLGEPRRHAIQEQIDRAPRLRARRRSTGSLGHLPHSASAAEPAGEDRRSERFEVRLAREPGIESLEPFGRIEQQRRRVAPAPPGKHDLGAQPGQSRALQLVQRADLRGREELVRRVGGAGLELGLRGGERAGSRAAPDRESARSPARERRPPPRCHRGLGPDRPTVPARRRPFRRARPLPGRDATLGDRDQPADRSPRPAHDGSPGARSTAAAR